jgi:hypothetical protein
MGGVIPSIPHISSWRGAYLSDVGRNLCARGSVDAWGPNYEPEGYLFDTQWGRWIFQLI